MILNSRDVAIIAAAVFALRIIAKDHFLDAWWPHTPAGRKNGERRLRSICKARLLKKYVVHAKAVRRVQLLYEGEPGHGPPDFEALSRESRRLWSRMAVQPVAVYVATSRGRNIFGGLERHRVHALAQISHDLGTSAVFTTLVQSRPDLATVWRSEDELLLPTGFGDAQPDAVLVDSEGRPKVAVEFAADYAAERFRRLVRTFDQQHLSYLIYGAAP